jgi:hypothetical protein
MGMGGHDHHKMPGFIPLLSRSTASGRALCAGAALGATMAAMAHLWLARALWVALGLWWRGAVRGLVVGLWRMLF